MAKAKAAETYKVNSHEIKLTNLDKMIWPEDGITKLDLIRYYTDISAYLLPYLKERPFVMSRYPDGIHEEFFYQKDCPGYAPKWIEKIRISSETRENGINYILCNNIETLIWLANQSCIEMHPWLSGTENLDCPDIAVFDLDPAPGVDFNEVLKIAVLIREALKEFGIEGYPKTSGATGLHIYIPIETIYGYETVKDSVHYICSLVHEIYPQKTTMERLVENRTGKVYLDYIQNGKGRTMACQYSLRPNPGAPVSAPVTWDEVREGTFKPSDFNINTILQRLKEKGDLYSGLLNNRQRLDKILHLMNPK